MVKSTVFGSAEWLEQVWSSPPVDKIKGRTRWTQAHQPWCDHLARHAAVQGRGEYVGLLALNYLKNLGVINRFKEHAFATSSADLGWEIRPDLFAEDQKKRLDVIEVKTARFVTGEVQMQLNANRTGLGKFGLRYLVWTDQYPLSRFVRHNLINMRRAASEDVGEEELRKIAGLVKTEGLVPLSHILDRGFDLDCIFSAWWQGRIFLPLTREINQRSIISDRSQEDLEALFLSESSHTDDWWSSLPPA